MALGRIFYRFRLTGNSFFLLDFIEIICEGAMIEIFLKLVEQLEGLDGLIRLKHDINRNLFKDHIEPIYKDLGVIVDNYHSILDEVNGVLNDFDFSKESGSRVVSMLLKRRLEHEQTRESLKRYSKILGENNNRNDIQKFAGTVFDLLNIEPVTKEMIRGLAEKRTSQSPATAATSLISDLTKVSITPESKRRALALIGIYKKKIDYHWDLASRAYYSLKTKYLA